MLLPVIFFGHGNPMNGIERNAATLGWNAIGRAIPRPKGIVCISAHWYLRGTTALTINTAPRTIHDFGGFPEELYAVRYPAPGDPDLARRVQQVLRPLPAELDESWGLDHGTWSVLTHVYPLADVPVVQLSIDASQPASFHYDIGRRLAVLREEGILIIGSGNLVHNLRMIRWNEPGGAYDWAVRFEHRVKELLAGGEHDPLIQYPSLGSEALLAVPTPDHYLPLLYVLGAAGKDTVVDFPVAGMEFGSISMLTVRCGEK
jgi:4,5-DOPA dioxygenase extradiol